MIDGRGMAWTVREGDDMDGLRFRYDRRAYDMDGLRFRYDKGTYDIDGLRYRSDKGAYDIDGLRYRYDRGASQGGLRFTSAGRPSAGQTGHEHDGNLFLTLPAGLLVVTTVKTTLPTATLPKAAISTSLLTCGFRR